MKVIIEDINDYSFEAEYADCLRQLDAMTDDEIDFSEMPEVTTLAGWKYADGTPVIVNATKLLSSCVAGPSRSTKL